MFVFLCIDFMMVLLYLIIGIIFIRSNGRAIRYLTGHVSWLRIKNLGIRSFNIAELHTKKLLV